MYMIVEDFTFVYLESSHVYDHCTLIYTIQLLLYQSLGSFMIIYVCLVHLLFVVLSIQIKSFILLSGIEVDFCMSSESCLLGELKQILILG